ncbi:hypothetical protein D6810_03000 [Candidatus Dojkabacteria bacterium]|uniref:Uncharacterized protein n=1 Tax=Candidatus Dojkabacteria bacterium TaxID=2099670 RepID=A0A3M0Z1D8_9BACT|nr:MAG: hypothetical protein D6810_03000 [Candidatus Dojkabacteria bacterium]
MDFFQVIDLSKQTGDSLKGISLLVHNLNIYLIVLFVLIGIGSSKFAYLAMITRRGPMSSIISILFVLIVLAFYKEITVFIAQTTVLMAQLISKGEFNPLVPSTYFSNPNNRLAIVLSNYFESVISPLSFTYEMVTDPMKFIVSLTSILALLACFLIVVLWKILMVLFYLLGPLAISSGLLSQWGRQVLNNWIRGFFSISIWPIWIALMLQLIKTLLDKVELESKLMNRSSGFDDFFISGMVFLMITFTPIICSYIIPSSLTLGLLTKGYAITSSILYSMFDSMSRFGTFDHMRSAQNSSADQNTTAARDFSGSSVDNSSMQNASSHNTRNTTSAKSSPKTATTGSSAQNTAGAAASSAKNVKPF